jgi:hypothetical protein
MKDRTFQLNRVWQLLALGSATLIFVFLAGHFIGVDPYDESIYLNSPTWMGFSAMITNQSWAPLYSNWYRILGSVVHDPLHRYFVSWAITASFAALFPVVFKVKAGWLHCLILITLPLLVVTPYVSLYAGCVLLVGICVILRWGKGRPISTGFAIGCVCTFVAAFVRPEFGYGVYFSAAATAVALGFEFKKLSNKRTALVKLLGVLCLAVMMNYVIHQSSWANRSAFALIDATNLRGFEDGQLPPGEQPFLSHWAQQQYGLDQDHLACCLTHRVVDFARAKPAFFAHHLWENLTDVRPAFLIVFVAFLTLYPWMKWGDSQLRAGSAYLLCICQSSIVSVLVVYPRDHYAMSLVPSLTIYSLHVLKPWTWAKPTRAWALGFAVFFLACIGVSVNRFQRAPFPMQRLNLERIQCGRAVDRAVLDGKPLVYDSTRDIADYTTHFRLPVYPEHYKNFAEFKHFALTEKPVWIAADSDVARGYGTNLGELDRFLREDLGYVAHICPADSALTVYAKQ